jgi:hypothetical protein
MMHWRIVRTMKRIARGRPARNLVPMDVTDRSGSLDCLRHCSAVLNHHVDIEMGFRHKPATEVLPMWRISSASGPSTQAIRSRICSNNAGQAGSDSNHRSRQWSPCRRIRIWLRRSGHLRTLPIPSRWIGCSRRESRRLLSPIVALRSNPCHFALGSNEISVATK